MRPKRILQVVGAMNRAGTETMLMHIYRKIDHENIQFDFISYSNEEADYDEEIKKLGGRVFHLSKTGSIKQLYDVMKRYGPYNAVHAHTLFHCGIANMAAMLAGVKIRIAHAHTTLDESDRLPKKIYIRLMRNLIDYVSTNLLACSKGAGRYLYGEKGIKRANYSYFPNVIDYGPYLKDYEAEVRKFKLEEGLENSLILGHIGRFIEAKNHRFILKILKCMILKNPTVKLVLVGDGDLRKEIEKKAEKEGISDHIRFVGKRKDVPILLQSMDMFVFPSHFEGLGLVLLEAQASGVPCIVSESIQPEADLNLGLVTKLSLADGPEAWAERIIESAQKKAIDKNKIVYSFINNEYSIPIGISKLMDLYEIKGVGMYEKRINRLV
ncbi:glycosyltransferase family 1 protein [Peribacillus psychrosaccharolyticus]|uniref:glycosyltransferase family 1 protein n=1 Tax=Peribacillus psychrosaccharolyticus TaxID=1407 RepID=UPI003D2A0F3A